LGQGCDLVISRLADTVVRGIEAVGDTVSEALFEPVIRLGVTGLARSGKTVFITSLVANLMDRGRMPGLVAAQEGRIDAAFLQPQPDDTVPRFDYESHLHALTAATPHWPDSTRAISELRLSLRVRPSGLLAGLQGPRTVHLDIVDYPGEWLLDLALLDKSYTQWSEETLARIASRPEADAFGALARSEDSAQPLDEVRAQALAQAFTAYLTKARDAGFYDCTPGRFLLPGDLAGSPVLTFAPLPAQPGAGRRSLWREMERRYEAYKAKVVTPFFRDHFARIDRQVVLVDALGAIHKGPRAVEDMRAAMADILGAFRPGRNAFLSRLLLGKRVEKILFAATKADHLHHLQHPRLTAIMEALTRDARDRAHFAGAQTAAMAIAALRATTEEDRDHNGETLNCVRGTLLNPDGSRGKQAAFFAGALPDDPGQLLGPARAGAKAWLDADYRAMSFAPAPLTLKPGDGPPHIRLDRAAQFLIGDRL
jgi:predicted YcjX-like family ATPase